MSARRIAFFAHYDRDGVIEDYVIYYLKELRKICSRILFASDCDVRTQDINKLEGIAEIVCATRHEEYDFGSWKRCFEAVNYDLTGYDELIVCNDSCFAPVFSLEDFFGRMDAKECDWWGPTWGWWAEKNSGGKHVNSYFMVFKRQVLADPRFYDFWLQIKKQPTKHDVIVKYELGITRYLNTLGFKFETLAERKVHMVFHPDVDMPWIRTETFRNNEFRVVGLYKKIEELGNHYDTLMINKYINRLCGSPYPPHYFFRIGTWGFKKFGFEISARLKKGKPNKQKDRRFNWWKVYAYVFGIPVFAFAWPLKREPGTALKPSM
jgi:hypothetical protein